MTMHGVIQRFRWQIAVRVIGVLLLIVGGSMVAWDLITSFRVMAPSPGGSDMSIAATVGVRHMALVSCLIGAVLVVISLVAKQSE
jgi:hypothetical protein